MTYINEYILDVKARGAQSVRRTAKEVAKFTEEQEKLRKSQEKAQAINEKLQKTYEKEADFLTNEMILELEKYRKKMTYTTRIIEEQIDSYVKNEKAKAKFIERIKKERRALKDNQEAYKKLTEFMNDTINGVIEYNIWSERHVDKLLAEVEAQKKVREETTSRFDRLKEGIKKVGAKTKELDDHFKKVKSTIFKLGLIAAGAFTYMLAVSPMLSAQLGLMRTGFNLIAADLGNQLAPEMQKLVDLVWKVVAAYMELSPQTKKLIAITIALTAGMSSLAGAMAVVNVQVLIMLGAFILIAGAIALLYVGIKTNNEYLTVFGSLLTGIVVVLALVKAGLIAVTGATAGLLAGIVLIVAGIISFVTGMVQGNDALAGMGAAMIAIGAIILGIAGVISAPIAAIIAVLALLFAFVWGMLDGFKEAKEQGLSFFSLEAWYIAIVSGWEKVRDVLQGAFDWIKGLFGDSWNDIWNVENKAEFQEWVDWFKGIWDSVTTFLQSKYDWIKGLFTNSWNDIWDMSMDSAINGLQAVASAVGDIFSNIGQTLTETFSNFIPEQIQIVGMSLISGIMYAVFSVIQAIFNTIANVFNGIVSAVSFVLDGISGVINSILDFVGSDDRVDIASWLGLGTYNAPDVMGIADSIAGSIGGDTTTSMPTVSGGSPGGGDGEGSAGTTTGLTANSFDTGGMVPGNGGEAVNITAHAGEVVLSRAQVANVGGAGVATHLGRTAGGGGGTFAPSINVTVNGGSNMNERALVDMIKRELLRELERKANWK